MCIWRYINELHWHLHSRNCNCCGLTKKDDDCDSDYVVDDDDDVDDDDVGDDDDGSGALINNYPELELTWRSRVDLYGTCGKQVNWKDRNARTSSDIIDDVIIIFIDLNIASSSSSSSTSTTTSSSW